MVSEEFFEGVGHRLLHLSQRLRGADAGNDVLALGVQEELP